MGYPLASFEGDISSWGTGGNFYTTLLSRMRSISVSGNITAPEEDVTGLTDASGQFIAGLGECTMEFEGFAFASPRLGREGLITFNPTTNTYVAHADRWSWEISWGSEIDITELSGAPTWRAFRPNGPAVSLFNYRAKPTSDAALANPFVPGTPASFPSLSLRYGDSATDETLSGSAIVTQLSPSLRMGEAQFAEYSGKFTGDVTPAGTGSVFGTTALGACPWSQGGSAAGAMVIATKKTATTKTITLADSFVTRLRMDVEVGKATRVSGTIRATGTVTHA